MKLLVNCDQVFDILTRGPFPAGEPSDEAVEHHLRACHDCRRLAEALRPAVELLHETVASEQAFNLPEYLGTLPPAAAPGGPAASGRLSDVRPATRVLTSGVRKISLPRASRAPATPDYIRLLNAARFVAVAVLVAALGTLAAGLAMSSAKRGSIASLESPRLQAPGLVAPRPQDPLVTLASLELPATCFPVEYRPLSAAQSAELLQSLEGGEHLLRCCTECHNAAQPLGNQLQLVAVTRDNCRACHRG